MPKAIWNGKVIAETDTYETVEGNVYFPARFRQPRILPAQRHPHGLRLEGDGELLHARRGRPGEPGRRLVLPGPQAGGGQHQGPHRLLARRGGGAVAWCPSSTPRSPASSASRCR